MPNLNVDNLCALILDLSGRGGWDEFIYCCEEFMTDEALELLEKAFEHGRYIEVDWLDD